MNNYMIQSLNDCEEINATFEEIIETYDDGCVLCRMWFENEHLDFPLNIDLYGFTPAKNVIDEKLKFKLALYYSRDGKLYKDEKEYNLAQEADAQKRAQKENSKAWAFASECVLPYGQFVDEGQQQNNTVMVHGRILSVDKAIYDGIESIHIKLGCQGYIFDVFLDDGVKPYPKTGNILCAIFDAIGLLLN